MKYQTATTELPVWSQFSEARKTLPTYSQAARDSKDVKRMIQAKGPTAETLTCRKAFLHSCPCQNSPWPNLALRRLSESRIDTRLRVDEILQHRSTRSETESGDLHKSQLHKQLPTHDIVRLMQHHAVAVVGQGSNSLERRDKLWITVTWQQLSWEKGEALDNTDLAAYWGYMGQTLA